MSLNDNGDHQRHTDNRTDARIWLFIALAAALLYVPVSVIDWLVPAFKIPLSVDGFIRVVIIGGIILAYVQLVARNSKARFDGIDHELAQLRQQLESVTNQIVENGLRIEQQRVDSEVTEATRRLNHRLSVVEPS